MATQFVQKITNSCNSFALHVRLELFQRSVPSRADQRCVDVFRFRSCSRLVRGLQVEQFAASAPLDSSRPISYALRLPVPAVRRLKNHVMPVAQIRFAKIVLGHFLATFLVQS